LHLSSQIPQTILINQIDAGRPKVIRLGKTRHIRIPHDIHRRASRAVFRPRCRLARDPLAHGRIAKTVGVEVVHETRPGAAHQFRQVEVALRHVQEGVDGVAEALDVVEDEGDFLEMRHADLGRNSGRPRVEAVAVGRDGRGGPGSAGQAPVGDEYFVAGVRGSAAVFEACDTEGGETLVGGTSWEGEGGWT
jgi:hypothetical protein